MPILLGMVVCFLFLNYLEENVISESDHYIFALNLPVQSFFA